MLVSASGWHGCRIPSAPEIGPRVSASTSPSCKWSFTLTQVFDRPLHGRVFLEEVLRENLDLGRIDNVRVTFDRAA